MINNENIIVPLRWKRCAEEKIQTKNDVAICTVELEKNT